MNYETGGFDGDRTAIEGPESRTSARRPWIIVAIVLLILGGAGAGWALWGGKREAPKPQVEQLASVTIVVPGRHGVDRQISATGSLAARREMPVGVAGEGGMVTRVLVEPGQWVGAGQVLATIDRSVQTQTAASLAASVNVARADLSIAQAELDRARQLVDRGFISKADLDRRTATRDAAAARVNVARATLGEARARTGQLDIRAPAAGLVLTRGVEPGQIVSAGSGMLFRMAKGGEMEMRAQLAESDLVTMRTGARASVTPVGDVRAFTGQVWQVAPIIDPTTRQGIARIALRYDPALRPGGFATAKIVSGTSDVPELPQSAIQSDDKGNFVYVIDAQDKVQRRNVRLGTVSESDVAIAEGLDGSERVVLSAGAFLNVGQKIRPVRQTATKG